MTRSCVSSISPHTRACRIRKNSIAFYERWRLDQDRVSALKDFVWAVICSREFAENH